MALIKCPECGKEISDRAQACPQCGCPINDTLEPTDDFTKYLLLAQQARKVKNTNDAMHYYTLAYESNPNNWEPVFYRAYYQELTGETGSAIENALPVIIQLIESIPNADEKANAYSELYTCCIDYLDAKYSAFEHSSQYYPRQKEFSNLVYGLIKFVPHELLSPDLKKRLVDCREHSANMAIENTNRGFRKTAGFRF